MIRRISAEIGTGWGEGFLSVSAVMAVHHLAKGGLHIGAQTSRMSPC